LMDGGLDSAIYRSTDGGDTWKKLTKGMPEGPLGRSAVAIAPSNSNHIYALIAAKHGMLWQSNDMGDSWTAVNDNHGLDVRAFYFSKLVVSPDDENRVYFMSFNMMESTDGGKTASVADRGVHSDHHVLWIDPKNSGRMILGTDGGAYLSTDGAKTWRFLDGMPIEQDYMVSANSRQPYSVCAGLQDNSSWCGPSSDLSRRGVANAAWYTVVGGDGEYAVFAPSDPDIIYTDSQDGSIERLDLKTHMSRSIQPYLEGVEAVKPADLKYRFNWTSPIAVSLTDANEVYLGGNVVFKSTDGGKMWAPISGDLTRNDKSKQEIAGGPVQHDISGAETYDTILTITLAPTDPKVIWVGTDDGLVQVTRDGGKSWKNVGPNISGAPEWARVYQVGVSPFDPGAVYVTYDAHELDNRGVYVYRTSDYGATWQKITDGLPDNSPAHVVRENPNKRGFLVAGTDTGLFYSSDRGGHWQ
ncbi:MAG: WD40/YVTN/BNR-like repeat-containing protein, partial [Candidatus Acidiferrales bacterium]